MRRKRSSTEEIWMPDVLGFSTVGVDSLDRIFIHACTITRVWRRDSYVEYISVVFVGIIVLTASQRLRLLVRGR